MTKKELKEIIINEYLNALESVDSPKNYEYRAGINYFMGWLSSEYCLDIKKEEVEKVRLKKYFDKD